MIKLFSHFKEVHANINWRCVGLKTFPAQSICNLLLHIQPVPPADAVTFWLPESDLSPRTCHPWAVAAYQVAPLGWLVSEAFQSPDSSEADHLCDTRHTRVSDLGVNTPQHPIRLSRGCARFSSLHLLFFSLSFFFLFFLMNGPEGGRRLGGKEENHSQTSDSSFCCLFFFYHTNMMWGSWIRATAGEGAHVHTLSLSLSFSLALSLSFPDRKITQTEFPGNLKKTLSVSLFAGCSAKPPVFSHLKVKKKTNFLLRHKVIGKKITCTSHTVAHAGAQSAVIYTLTTMFKPCVSLLHSA